MLEPQVNNEFYHQLGEAWLHGQDHPIALLRAEAPLKNKWVIENLQRYLKASARVLDVGCGAGLLSNPLAAAGFEVVGVDVSTSSLAVARAEDLSRTVRYVEAAAENLPFAQEYFAAVACMDVLEHVADFNRVVAESARVLRPGGVFLFHTFNRTWAARILAVFCVEKFFKNAPKNLHVYAKFITPLEMRQACAANGLRVVETVGLRPSVSLAQAVQILRTGEVPLDFRFELTRSLAVGYMGVAVKGEAG